MLVFFKILLYIPIWLLFPTIFKGTKNIPKKNAIFVCNHRSNVDAILLVMSTWRKQKFLAKKELFKSKFFGGILKSFGAIPIDRQKTDLNAIKLSLNVLKKGKILTIFPEGTRNKSDLDLGEVKTGACMLAVKSHSPIVPIWIKKKPKPFCLNVIKFGKPFYLDAFYDRKLDKDALNDAGEILSQKILENKIGGKHE